MPKRRRAKPPSKRQAAAKPRARKGCSLRAFARHIGKPLSAVQKAIASGRLSDSVGHDAKGVPRILDVQKAVWEWRDRGFTLSEAQRRATLERARSYRLSNLQKEGQLYDRSAAKREAFDCARVVRDGMLNLPDRLAAELAAEMDPVRVHVRLTEEIRKVLEVLAEALAYEPPLPAAAEPSSRGTSDAA